MVFALHPDPIQALNIPADSTMKLTMCVYSLDLQDLVA